MADKAYLTLSNGQTFVGDAFGAQGEVTGELVFTTAMTGYLETLTDPSYYGQIVTQTFPLIGNYGVIPSDFESESPALRAYIVRQWCQDPSNFRSEGTLDAFLISHHIIGLSGIDTRALTRIVREYGVMNARISRSPLSAEQLEDLKNYVIRDAVRAVSTLKTEIHTPQNPRRKVVLWDFGAKANIRRELLRRDCQVVTVPYDYTAEQILSLNPQGIMLSNGPGDPAENTGVIRELKKLCQAKIPTFGICLGHQLLALSQGAETHKLKYGHRGTNQPAKDLVTGRIYITSQNHGYAVINETIPQNALLRLINANDQSCEGIDYRDMPAFSVQFHPEACGGPKDTGFLFDRFVSLMDRYAESR